MTVTSVKVNAKYQITIPQIVRKKLNIKQRDRLLMDVQDGVIVLILQPKSYTDYLQGLHSEIWKLKNISTGEHGAWTNSANN